MTKTKLIAQKKIRKIGTKLVSKIENMNSHDKHMTLFTLGLIDETYRSEGNASKFEADVKDILNLDLKTYTDTHENILEDYLWVKF